MTQEVRLANAVRDLNISMSKTIDPTHMSRPLIQHTCQEESANIYVKANELKHTSRENTCYAKSHCTCHGLTYVPKKNGQHTRQRESRGMVQHTCQGDWANTHANAEWANTHANGEWANTRQGELSNTHAKGNGPTHMSRGMDKHTCQGEWTNTHVKGNGPIHMSREMS